MGTVLKRSSCILGILLFSVEHQNNSETSGKQSAQGKAGANAST